MKKDHERFQALYLLSEGESPANIAESLNCSYSSVLRWKREYEDAKIAGTLKKLMDFPTEVVEQMGELIMSKSHPDLHGEIGKVTKQLSGLQVLNGDLIQTAAVLDRRIRTMAMGAESTSELLDLTACLVKLQDTFFKNPPPVLIPQGENTSSGPQAYGALLSDKPAV